MRIAQVAPLYESVPPRFYGGTERVVSFLTEELVRQGHDVTLFASSDSRTSARLVGCCAHGLRLDAACRDTISPHVLMIERALARGEDFDVFHFHTETLHYATVRRTSISSVTTLHGRLDSDSLSELLRDFDDLPLVSISDAQRAPIPNARWQSTIHHGLPSALLRCGRGDGGYLAFLGRASPEKGLDRAIEIARRAGWPLKIGAKIDPWDRAFFESEIKPQLSDPRMQWVGEIAENQKQAFLGGAAALLFPISWPEPFGLVMIEALACGTPVIAYPCGAVTEVLEDGVTAILVQSVAEAVGALRMIDTLDRATCRRVFEERFTVERMAREYVSVYRRS